MSQLPIQDVMPQLLSGIQQSPQLILKAAPGAGKSTRFPLELLRSGIFKGKIVMLEPRRLAAKNIARYLAEQLGEVVGQSIGYRMRGESRTGRDTRLEIVTEGIMTRMIQSDPELDGIDVLIFDEYHERSIHADTALALSLEIQSALREDLRLVVMSATLDSEALRELLPYAAYVESQGRRYPVEYRYRPAGRNESLSALMAQQIRTLLASESGSLLAFLPGAALIRLVGEQLRELPSDTDLYPLYGQLNFSEQQRAIEPAARGLRKVVLATNIAETSLTIEGIRMVVDSGLERVAKFDLKTGITRLEQCRIAQSSAEQRAGRAGRLESGVCVRLYSESQLRQQPAVPVAEILQSDLTALALELVQWGVTQASDLAWLDTPPDTAMNQAWALLYKLGLIDEKRQLTPDGITAQQLGVDPRFASMLVKSEFHGYEWLNTALAAVVLLEEPEKQVSDLQQSLHRWQEGHHTKAAGLTRRASQLARKLDADFCLSSVSHTLLSVVLALAFPDRIAQQRGGAGQFRLANGHGAEMAPEERLSDSRFLIAIDMMRYFSESSRILLGAELDIKQLQQALPELFDEQEWIDWDEKRGQLYAESRLYCGALIIQRSALPQPNKEKMTQALLNYVRRKGLSVLNWSQDAREWLTRIQCAVEWLPDEGWPAMDEQSLLAEIDQWLLPYMQGVTSVKALQNISLVEALSARLGWPLSQQVDEWLPTHHRLPTGSRKLIRYQPGAEPILSVRMQEVFGEKDSPTIAKGTRKVILKLLSPAQRPLQITGDLAAFWDGAYKDVQKEMKGRYPKHVWPDDPATHVATTKTKRQLNHDNR